PVKCHVVKPSFTGLAIMGYSRLTSVVLPHLAILIVTVGAAVTPASSAEAFRASEPAIKWAAALAQTPQWYAGSEALRIADNLLLYQRNSGGWPKNIDMAQVLAEPTRAQLTKEKPETDSTIDNNSTYTQLIFLARVYSAQRLPRHRDAFFKGIDYLLAAQY